MRIIFTGGGTLGSVTPLIALYEALSKPVQAVWIGTRSGPERELVCEYHMPFRAIFSGKLRRYLSIKNFFDPILFCIGMVQAARVISVFRPDYIIGAGGYVSVPVIWAGWLLKKKIIILQLDIQPSLTNLMTHFFAQKIALACEEQKIYFPARKSVVTGIPVRKKVHDLARQAYDREWRGPLRQAHGISDDALPVVLIVGGGTGALSLNHCVYDALGELTRISHVVHVTGKGKGSVPAGSYIRERYHAYEFLKEELIEYAAFADCVVTRAGMGMLSELSVLGKPTIIIPIPQSHQEKNAVYFERQKHAAIYLVQNDITAEKFVRAIQRVLKDDALRQELSQNMKLALPQDGAQNVKGLIEEVI